MEYKCIRYEVIDSLNFLGVLFYEYLTLIVIVILYRSKGLHSGSPVKTIDFWDRAKALFINSLPPKSIR